MATLHPLPGIESSDLEAFCIRWKVRELALFGSTSRWTGRPDSDIDLMVEFAPDAVLGVWDLGRMQGELEDFLGRKVDLVEKGTIENPYRLASISRDLKVVYAA